MSTAQPLGQMIVELGLDNSNFTRGMKGVNQQVKTSMTEMKAHLNVMGRSGNEVDILRAKQAGLTSVVEAQNSKVELAREKYEACREAVEGNSEATQEQKDALIKAQNEYVKAVGELGSYENQLKEVDIKLTAMESTTYKVGSALETMGNGLTNIGDNLTAAGMAITAGVTTPLIALGAYALKTTAEFDSAMSEVSAVSGVTGRDFDSLRDKAREMGEKTKFSATDAANAMNYMAMAGWKTTDMLNGIDGIMNLAAASGEDLALTSDIVTDALTAFGLSASDSGHFADILAAASSNANTNVSMMGQTFKYCAPVAGALGYSAEDAAEQIGLMGNAGIKSSQAGTALRTILSSLSGEVTFTGSKLGEYTVQTAKADGSMRDLNDIMDDCRVGFSQLTESEAASTAEMLVGKNAMSGFLAIMNAGTDDIAKLRTSIEDCDGTAESMAETMQDNLLGQLTILGSQVQELAISFGDILMPPVRNVVSGVQELVDRFNKLDNSTKENVVRISLLAAAVGPTVIVVGKLTSGVGSLVTNVGKGMQSFALWAAKISHTTSVTAAQTAATAGNTTATAANTAATTQNSGVLVIRSAKALADTAVIKTLTAAEKLRTAAIAAGNGTLTAQVTALNASIISKTKDMVSTTAHTVSMKAYGVAVGVATGQISLQTIATGAFTVATNLCATATGLLAAAIKLLTGPVGWLIAAAGLLVTGVIAVVKWFNKESEASQELTADIEDLSNANETLIDGLETSEAAYGDNVDAIKAEAGAANTLTDKIRELSAVENKSAAQKKELATYVDMLNGSVEDLNLQYDEQTDSLNMTTDAIYDQVSAFEKQAEAQVAQERLTEILKEQITVKEQLVQVQDKIGEANENTGLKEKERRKIIAELEEQESSLQEQLESLGESYSYVTDVIVESSEEQAQAVEDQAAAYQQAAAEQQQALEDSMPSILSAYDTLGDAYKDMGEKQKEAIDGVLTSYQTMTRSLADLNKEIELDQETSWYNIQKNQADTIKKTEEFSGLYAQLIKAGISESYLNAIGATGPESIPLLQDMLRQGTDTVLQSQNEWESAYGVIGDTLVDSLGLEGEAKEAVKDYVLGEAGIVGTLRGAIANADLNGLGMSVTEGLRKGLLDSVDNVNDATKELVEGFTDEAREELGINSPSRVFKEIGKFVIEGLVQGINGEQNGLDTAIKNVMKSAAKIATDTMDTALKQVSKVTASTFSTLPVDAKNGMTGMNTAITSGMNTGKRTVSDSMKNIESTTKSSMQNVRTYYSSGFSSISSDTSSKMSNISSVMASGQRQTERDTSSWMSGLRSSISSGFSSIISVVDNGTDRIIRAFDMYNSMYRQGTDAMDGFSAGLSAREYYIYSKAQRIANNVAWTISDALDIHSPSRVLKKLGEYTMQGFGLGIEGMQSYIGNVVEDTAGIVSDGFSNTQMEMPVLTVNTEAIQKINRTLEVTAEEEQRKRSGDKVDQLIALLEAYLPAMMERMKLNKLYDILEEFLPEMANMQMVTDTGTLIGELAPGLDDYLGEIKKRRDRE